MQTIKIKKCKIYSKNNKTINYKKFALKYLHIFNYFVIATFLVISKSYSFSIITIIKLDLHVQTS